MRALLLALGVAGCNSILDNKPGQPVGPSSTPTDVAPIEPEPDASLPALPKSEQPEASTRTPEDDAGSSPLCGAGQTICHGACVGATDPLYGCGAPGCAACIASHGTPTCQGNTCTVKACDAGYADCNQNPADGCETDLSKATSCGSCNAVCPAAAPVCTTYGASFQCMTGCTPAAPLLCGAECVSPLTSVNHCGACNAKCADVERAEVTCEAGACKLTCKPDHHACAGTCVVNTDPLACGAACTVCPVPPNAAATCQADTCAFQCNAGYGNCNVDPIDGCESTFAIDPLNCGGCGKTCNGGACVAGVCELVDAGP